MKRVRVPSYLRKPRTSGSAPDTWNEQVRVGSGQTHGEYETAKLRPRCVATTKGLRRWAFGDQPERCHNAPQHGKAVCWSHRNRRLHDGPRERRAAPSPPQREKPVPGLVRWDCLGCGHVYQAAPSCACPSCGGADLRETVPAVAEA